ncbi:hypothetical protein E2C01_052564 [Portunus trituberculatus]|uniref:Uncharacterized protein n=1 Tax=Portunus trituberculatus TaxID=210409 RepID=A0A5B7GMT6_PORTR|nr:hypothetical protein [Portunus trituberculatus]
MRWRWEGCEHRLHTGPIHVRVLTETKPKQLPLVPTTRTAVGAVVNRQLIPGGAAQPPADASPRCSARLHFPPPPLLWDPGSPLSSVWFDHNSSSMASRTKGRCPPESMIFVAGHTASTYGPTCHIPNRLL